MIQVKQLGYFYDLIILIRDYQQALFLVSCLVAFGIASYDHADDWHSVGKYKFEYAVKDPRTGDHKSQWEISNGDGLKGGYTVDEPDGTKRLVQYKADKWHGFQAIVKRIGQAVHPQNYGSPFVVRHQDQHQPQEEYKIRNTGHSPVVGNNFWKQSNQYQLQQLPQNGWVDQQAAYSGNGWKTGGGLPATSYANQNIYHYH
ncbi:uncharacterized protein LOC128736134 [Sabethes cyaneus]|uniref:uncharacterized protein LOC128736134 n=1 Tax=Sabethes cyaneus TaxID=53552 RepID=UPI00237E266F|nr:uncharacterized protein LOC128736134 [Sabethes cyaneus]